MREEIKLQEQNYNPKDKTPPTNEDDIIFQKNIITEQQILSVEKLEENQLKNKDQSSNQDQSIKYVSDKARWFILAMYSYIAGTNLIYSGILDQAQDYYDISEQNALLFSNSFMYTQFATTFIFVYLFEKRQRLSLILAIFFNFIGCWGRYLAKKNYIITIVSQFIIAPTMCFTLSTYVQLVYTWFQPKEQFTAISISCYMGYIGIAFGYFLSPMIIGEDSDEIPTLLLIEALICSFPIFSCFFIKSKPNYPIENSMTEIDPYWLSLWKLLRNFKYLILIIAFSQHLSLSWTLTSIMYIFLDERNYSARAIGLIGLLYAIAGIVGGFFASLFIVLKKNSELYWKYIIFALTIISLASTSLFIILIDYVSNTVFLLLLFIAGFGLVGIIPFLSEILSKFVPEQSVSVNISIYYVIGGLFCLLQVTVSTVTSIKDYGIHLNWISILLATIYIFIAFDSFFKKIKTNDII